MKPANHGIKHRLTSRSGRPIAEGYPMLDPNFPKERSKSVEYRYDPVRWAQDVMGITLWSKQQEVLRSLVTHTPDHQKRNQKISQRKNPEIRPPLTAPKPRVG